MIHTSLLGDGFEKHVMNRSEQIEVQSGIRGQHEPYGALLLALLCTAGYTYYVTWNKFVLVPSIAKPKTQKYSRSHKGVPIGG